MARPRPVARALFALAAALVPHVASAQLAGQTIGAQYLYPNLGTVQANLGSAVVGPGIEFVAVAQATADVSDASVTIGTVLGGGPVEWLPAAFSGFRLYDVGGTVPDFLSVALNPASNLPGFDASRVTWDADNIRVNVQGLVQLPGQVVVLDVGFATVPEPATVALVATGLLAVAAVARRKV